MRRETTVRPTGDVRVWGVISAMEDCSRTHRGCTNNFMVTVRVERVTARASNGEQQSGDQPQGRRALFVPRSGGIRRCHSDVIDVNDQRSSRDIYVRPLTLQMRSPTLPTGVPLRNPVRRDLGLSGGLTDWERHFTLGRRATGRHSSIWDDDVPRGAFPGRTGGLRK
jgi:hypothetical protein